MMISPAKFGVLLMLLLAACAAQADKADRVIEGEKANTKLAADSQQRINKISDKTQQLFQNFQLELKRIDDLTLYNQQMKGQISRQMTSITDTTQAIDEVAIVERQLSPLLHRMVDSLSTFIKLDVPFLLDERFERVAFLRHTLDRTDVTLAEKFRQVIEAYNVEVEYGNTIESYRGNLNLGDRSREVEFLRIGRVALLYQSLDGNDLGAWNSDTHRWQPLDGRYRRDIRLGLKVAKKQAAPELLLLPVLAPES
ncbi:DUF3450 domain-containing protein [Ketobacter sp. MCCC 1A13808]|uniref:DUF3450 domain-containing protein n=1 Tax=Ketobacter sp. MCCC 1A13808 TaxID=2602738 RepID=UPI000F1F0435|nr:DUF3450 domain-containing protein [Ketobacter sp. MCCC 1A13808]MVF14266.1 DUF3450 domain-containing protein [Ketobacter sp. MCCC 1A13808]RLP53517.1 MAG: DUF3450 domain-containing protein [Ketobacter sp.]